jgi:hypothetical protein
MERQDPEIYLLRDFDKAEIKGETLTIHFKRMRKVKIQLQQPHKPEQLKEVRDLIEQAAEIIRVNKAIKS